MTPGDVTLEWQRMDAERKRLRRIEAAASAMFAQEDGVCVECGWVGDHAAPHADVFARACLTLPLRAALLLPSTTLSEASKGA